MRDLENNDRVYTVVEISKTQVTPSSSVHWFSRADGVSVTGLYVQPLRRAGHTGYENHCEHV